MNNLNPNSHLTAILRTSLSYPARILMNQKRIHGKVLDFGCGIGKDVELLQQKGYDIVGYDPFYFPDYPKEKFDTILCFYVLNVLLPEEQAQVLLEVSSLLKPGGSAYFAVRRDVSYQGYRMHKLHKKETYQCQVQLPYHSIFLNDNCEIYEYQHYNQLARNHESNCVFCNPNAEHELIVESATVYAIYDKFPVNEGHALIIPKRHCADYFDLSFKEQAACLFVLNKVKELVAQRFKPDGFNVGINIGEKAGQTIHHVHIHLIPRYDGDVEEPRGGVRGVNVVFSLFS